MLGNKDKPILQVDAVARGKVQESFDRDSKGGNGSSKPTQTISNEEFGRRVASRGTDNFLLRIRGCNMMIGQEHLFHGAKDNHQGKAEHHALEKLTHKSSCYSNPPARCLLSTYYVGDVSIQTLQLQAVDIACAMVRGVNGVAISGDLVWKFVGCVYLLRGLTGFKREGIGICVAEAWWENWLSLADFGSKRMRTDKEVIVNGILHDRQFTLTDDYCSSSGHDSSIKEKVRETIERAFWDGIIESMEGDEPQYDRITQLMKEVRDELCNIAPESCNEELNEAIDVDLLAKVLKSWNLDDNYLPRIWEFAWVTLQKLSSPASEDKLKNSHQQLLRELASIYAAVDTQKNARDVAMKKDLRFVLEQIKVLKLEISKARMQLTVPILKGEAGFDYLRTVFANRCGLPAVAMRQLPLTVEWLPSLPSNFQWNGLS